MRTSGPPPAPDHLCAVASLVQVALCGFFTILATVFSLRDVRKHLTNYCDPERQRRIVRILLLVPIYAIDGESRTFETWDDCARRSRRTWHPCAPES